MNDRMPTTEPRTDAAPDVVIRLADERDAEALARLAAMVATLPLLVRYGVVAAHLGDELGRVARGDGGGQQLLLAESGDGDLLGFARVLTGGGAGGGQFGRGAYLKLIALRPGCEGRGIGRRLLDSVERTAAERCPDLFLLASDFNHGAHRFYERSGYRRVGELPEFVCPGITEIIYWKRLRPR